MTLIILIVILILPFIFVALGMSMWAAIISWLLLIVVALAANVWYYTFTEEGREKWQNGLVRLPGRGVE